LFIALGLDIVFDDEGVSGFSTLHFLVDVDKIVGFMVEV
jgi:hypothetical protein